jgi:hypothetical protein
MSELEETEETLYWKLLEARVKRARDEGDFNGEHALEDAMGMFKHFWILLREQSNEQ